MSDCGHRNNTSDEPSLYTYKSHNTVTTHNYTVLLGGYSYISRIAASVSTIIATNISIIVLHLLVLLAQDRPSPMRAISMHARIRSR